MSNNFGKVESVISIDYSGKILSARESYLVPELSNEEILPIEIREKVIMMARKESSNKKIEYDIDYFNTKRALILEILKVYDWQIDVLVSEYSNGGEG